MKDMEYLKTPEPCMKELLSLPLSRLFVQLLFQDRFFPYPSIQEESCMDDPVCYEVTDEFARLAYDCGTPILPSAVYVSETVNSFWDNCLYVDKVRIVKGFLGFAKKQNAERYVEMVDCDLNKNSLMTDAIEDHLPEEIKTFLGCICTNFASEFDKYSGTVEQETVLCKFELYNDTYRYLGT